MNAAQTFVGSARLRSGRARMLLLLSGAPKVAVLVLLTSLASAVLADAIAPHSATTTKLEVRELPPMFMDGGSPDYVLGTDRQGRDVLSRIIVGARVSFSVAALAVLLGGSVGTALGLISGYAGGFLDAMIMRFVDVMLAFPSVLLALILALTVGPSYWTVVAVLSFILWARYARLVRGDTLTWKQRDFVALAQVAGCSPARIMLVHLLPNLMGSLIVLSTLQVGWVIISEASLNFLGVGVPGPTPTWGGMIAEGRNDVVNWWVPVFPGIVVFLIVFSVNTLGDWLRDRLDPRLRQI